MSVPDLSAPGQASPRDAERRLSALRGEEIRLGENVVVSSGLATCLACDSTHVEWAVLNAGDRGRDEIHPVVWHQTDWLADRFVCSDCCAGWIEPDDPAPVICARPFWRIDA